jgi:hypothetical protein
MPPAPLSRLCSWFSVLQLWQELTCAACLNGKRPTYLSNFQCWLIMERFSLKEKTRCWCLISWRVTCVAQLWKASMCISLSRTFCPVMEVTCEWCGAALRKYMSLLVHGAVLYADFLSRCTAMCVYTSRTCSCLLWREIVKTKTDARLQLHGGRRVFAPH